MPISIVIQFQQFKKLILLAIATTVKQRRNNSLMRKRSQENLSISHAPPCLAEYLMAETEENRKQFALKKQNIENELYTECTFHPKLLNRSVSQGLSNIGIKKCLQLFQQRRKGRKSLDRTTEEIEYERQRTELTFAPHISNNKKNVESGHTRNVSKSIRSFHKSVSRLKESRNDQKLLELAKQLGNTLSESGIKKLKNHPILTGRSKEIKKSKAPASKKSAKPLFELEVKINNTLAEKVIIHEGDRPDQIANNLAKKHNLDAEARQKIKAAISLNPTQK